MRSIGLRSYQAGKFSGIEQGCESLCKLSRKIVFLPVKSDTVNRIEEKLALLFENWAGEKPAAIIPLPGSGSDRRYYRMTCRDRSAVGAWNPVKEENEAFLHFSEVFLRAGLHVPEIFAQETGENIYLLEDLGDISLFTLMENQMFTDVFPGDIENLYRYSLSELVRFQVIGGKNINYAKCFPHASFDKRSMCWDLNYFKYYFLKLHVPFHEGKLEDDFNAFADYLSGADHDYFMYRDFQSRNIMIHEGKPFFIDYQGGRKGPLQYDVASLLFQVKADLPFALREKLLDHYMAELGRYITTDPEKFREQYYGFVLIRLLQVLGAYGFRGLIEKKPHFLASIPYALKNIRWWLESVKSPVPMPELIKCLEQLALITKYDPRPSGEKHEKLTVTVRSFSYKDGVPADCDGNGGGFVFDCRALPNPGREEKYRAFNGKDLLIIDYLKDEPAVIFFLEETEKLLSINIDNYLERGFSHLSVYFGCTGGQHRSVYCTETIAARLRMKYPGINVRTEHLKLN